MYPDIRCVIVCVVIDKPQHNHPFPCTVHVVMYMYTLCTTCLSTWQHNGIVVLSPCVHKTD